jgi:uncharacterized protein YkwD
LHEPVQAAQSRSCNGAHRSDIDLVPAATAARTTIGRRLRRVALLGACLCCCVGGASTPAAARAPRAHSAASYTSSAHRERGGCARRASFRSSSPTHGRRAGSHRRGRRFACRRHRRHARRRAVRRHATGACANALLRPSEADLPLVRAATLCLVNRERTSRGEAPLRPNVDLQRAAQSHSGDMASASYFAHESRSGQTPLARMRACGYIFSARLGYAIGENIAWGTLSLATPKAIVAGWMASPGHRANILDAAFRDTGVGIAPHPLASLARGQAGAIYTQDFGRILRP